jgi:hypothetical protein
MPIDDLPGVEGEGVSQQKKIKAVEEAFGDLLSAREKRMTHGEKEQAASAVLVQLFHRHNLKDYTYDDRKYTLAQVEKIKLAPKAETADED